MIRKLRQFLSFLGTRLCAEREKAPPTVTYCRICKNPVDAPIAIYVWIGDDHTVINLCRLCLNTDDAQGRLRALRYHILQIYD